MESDEIVLNCFLNVLPAYKRSSKGWLTFNCPGCGDSRGRGAFLCTSSGGWRFTCKNAGCDFANTPTGWEPGSGLGGRPRKLFQLLGGQIRNLPLDILFKKEDTFNGNRVAKSEETAVYHFDTVKLPENSVPLLDPGEWEHDPNYQQVLHYLYDRGEEFFDLWQFFWSPSFPTFLIIPYYHNGRVVGYLSRNSVKDSKTRFFQESHSDYLFNQQVLNEDNRWAVVGEGVMNAIAVAGCASRGPSLTKKQMLLLNLSGKNIIVLPDQQKDGRQLVAQAEENDWWVSSPDWDRDVKDAATAMKRYGLLYTVESVIASAHKNYLKAKTSISLK
jgi:hypothetical protein